MILCGAASLCGAMWRYVARTVMLCCVVSRCAVLCIGDRKDGICLQSFAMLDPKGRAVEHLVVFQVPYSVVWRSVASCGALFGKRNMS